MRLAAAASIALVVAAVPTALALSAGGEAIEVGSRAATLGVVLVVAWVIGLGFAVLGAGAPSHVHRPERPVPYPDDMPPRHDPHDLSTAAQQYLLALRVMAGSADGGRVTAAQIARHLGVTTQAASEMFRRLVADGLVAQADGRQLHLTHGGRTAADGIFRRHALLEWLLTTVDRPRLGRVRR